MRRRTGRGECCCCSESEKTCEEEEGPKTDVSYSKQTLEVMFVEVKSTINLHQGQEVENLVTLWLFLLKLLMLTDAPLTCGFQHWTSHHQSHCDWLPSSLEGVVDPAGGRRKWASADQLTHSSLTEQRRKAGFGSVLDVRVKEVVII